LSFRTEVQPRLNPFAFPPDTTSRFFLLLVFVTAADILYWHGIASQLGGTITELDRCLYGHPAFGPDMLDPSQLALLTRCAQLLSTREAPWLAVGVALLACATLALYWMYPVWLRWRFGLTTFPEEELPDVTAELEELCALAELRQRPAFLWNPLDGSPQPKAYGRRGGYCIALTGGLLGHAKHDSFRAIVLHELAHIRNGDIPKTYLALAVWWGFLATALVPYLLVALVREHQWWNLLDVFSHVAIFAGIVLLSRNAVLRARELYADVRASSWELRPCGLAAAIAALRPRQRPLSWFSVHPDPALRRLLLEDTDPLFRAGFWDALSIGAAAAVALFTMLFLLDIVALRFGLSFTETNLLAPSFVVVPLAAAAAGSMVWRSSLLAGIRGRRPRATGRIAVGLAAGATLGLLFSVGYPLLVAAAGGPGNQLLGYLPVPVFVLLVIGAAVVIIAILLLTATFALYLSWVEACARAWLPMALRLRTPRAVWMAGLVIASALATLWFSFLPLLVIGGFISEMLAGTQTAASAATRLIWATHIFPLNLIAWVSMIAVWAYPMAALLWRPGPNPGGTTWAFLDPALPIKGVSPLRPRRALLVGVISGLAGALALWWMTIDLPAEVLHQVYLPETAFGARLLSLVLIAIIAQLAAGVVAAVAARRLGFVQAMFAAFIAGWVLVTAECLIALTWHANAGVLLDWIVVPTLVGGAAVTLPAVAVISALLDRRTDPLAVFVTETGS
jgi:Zn-dependent protease with chaperone function